MGIDSGVFGDTSCFEQRFIADYSKLAEWVAAVRTAHPGIKIVLTSGTFDLYHIGHARYLEQAKSTGDVLIVGVDSDEKTRSRKGPDRPVIPEVERLELLVHDRSVDIVTIKGSEHKHWELIDRVRPDILVATQETYSPEEIQNIEEDFGCIVSVLPPQAQSSTSNQIRSLNLGFAKTLKAALIADVPDLVDKAIEQAMKSAK